MDYFKIGAFLQELRKEKGITQVELSEMLGVSSKSVSKWECGGALPEIPLLVEVARYYGVTVDEILKGERNVPIEKEEASVDSVTYERDSKKLAIDILTIIAYSVTALAYLLLFVLGYTTYNCNIQFFVSVCVLFIGVILIGSAYYLSKNKKLLKNYIPLAILVFMDGLISYVWVRSETDMNAVMSIGPFLILNLICIGICVVVYCVVYNYSSNKLYNFIYRLRPIYLITLMINVIYYQFLDTVMISYTGPYGYIYTSEMVISFAPLLWFPLGVIILTLVTMFFKKWYFEAIGIAVVSLMCVPTCLIISNRIDEFYMVDGGLSIGDCNYSISQGIIISLICIGVYIIYRVIMIMISKKFESSKS